MGYIYLLQERELVKNGEQVYKLGRTACISNRLSKNPNGSIPLSFSLCNNSVTAKRELLVKFRAAFTPRTDIGAKYFEGNVIAMMDMIHGHMAAKLCASSVRLHCLQRGRS